MRIELTETQAAHQRHFRQFVCERIAPVATRADQEQQMPRSSIDALAEKGYLGALVSSRFGGLGLDMVSFGLLNEELGAGCSSIRSLLTVHSMVCSALAKWGTTQQQEKWLPALASGRKLAAFALSEPDVGSDAASVKATARRQGDGWLLDGQKRWTTFGELADVFLVFARTETGPAAFLVERNVPGLTVQPVRNLLGIRGSMTANLELTGCVLGEDALLANEGFGIGAVAMAALDIGRYSVAWGCVGISRSCLEVADAYARERVQFGAPLHDHQLIRRMLTEMITGTQASRLMCLHAGYLKDIGDPATLSATFMAKYFASTTAARIATDAVQVLGAQGCTDAYPVERHYRDVKVMEIIEGSTQIQQLAISRDGAW